MDRRRVLAIPMQWGLDGLLIRLLLGAALLEAVAVSILVFTGLNIHSVVLEGAGRLAGPLSGGWIWYHARVGVVSFVLLPLMVLSLGLAGLTIGERFRWISLPISRRQVRLALETTEKLGPACGILQTLVSLCATLGLFGLQMAVPELLSRLAVETQMAYGSSIAGIVVMVVAIAALWILDHTEEPEPA